jgi:hypothetical protein
MSRFMLKTFGQVLLLSDFDSFTRWPPSFRMPPEFDPHAVLDLGRSPGLGVRALHLRGVTGAGVAVAIIDQPLLVEHREYASRLQIYEEINLPLTHYDWPATSRGTGTASLLVGKTAGVAPGSLLYYVALWPVDVSEKPAEYADVDFSLYAQALDRILNINAQLPEAGRIRVVVLTIEWSPDSIGYSNVKAAAERAMAAGIFVACPNMEELYGFRLRGLDRPPPSDPASAQSYTPGERWAESFYTDGLPGDTLLVPANSRTMASPSSGEAYVFRRFSGSTTAGPCAEIPPSEIPYIAGLYALAAQVDPGITPDRFWRLALATGWNLDIQHDRKTYSLGRIIDPSALIAALESGG